MMNNNHERSPGFMSNSPGSNCSVLILLRPEAIAPCRLGIAFMFVIPYLVASVFPSAPIPEPEFFEVAMQNSQKKYL